MRLPEQGHVVQICIKCGKPKSHHTVAKSVLGLTSLPYFPVLYKWIELQKWLAKFPLRHYIYTYMSAIIEGMGCSYSKPLK